MNNPSKSPFIRASFLGMMAITIMCLVSACNSDPGACNCAKNAAKIMTGGMDADLAKKCDKYVKSLGPTEGAEYAARMAKCAFQ